jgi:DNA-binding response OmpR family regulator
VDPVSILDSVGLGPIERAIAVTLAKRLDRWTSTAALIAAAYAGAWDEPDDPANCLKSVCHILRRKLRPHGLTIEGVPYYGRRMVRT